jgi:2-oxoglutarate ferredoxin oxidoreductase subunit delta
MTVHGTIEVNDFYCKGCALCIPACPQGVMALETTRLTPKGYHPVMLIGETCTGCGICAIICPDAAITVYRDISPRQDKREIAVQGEST